MVYQEWTTFKTNVTNKSALRFLESELFYTIKYNDFDSSIMKDSGADQTDFETNYKSLANKTTTPEAPAFDSKKIGTKSLFTRTMGVAYILAVGANTLDYTIPYTACKINGLEIVNAETGDFVDLKVAHPTYGVLSQFAFNAYLSKDYYERISNYDADLFAGLILRIVYNSVTAKTVYVNYLLHEVV